MSQTHWNNLEQALKPKMADIHAALLKELPAQDIAALCSELKIWVSKRVASIEDDIAEKAETKVRREIGRRPRDAEEYDTSEEDQSKSNEDEEEVMERKAEEIDGIFADEFPEEFPDELIAALDSLHISPNKSALTALSALQVKYFGQ